ncbi:MAG: hypothetical protein CL459_02230 [Acidimicrobiaceae bacterium]|nr:hypothetical protein [Acidimicrobiaceae bacterium]
MSAPAPDPVLVRRERMRRLAATGKRLGYLAFLAAIVLFAVGLIGDFTSGIATTLVVLLFAGSIVLAPAIVLHYAVQAADDEDAGRPSRH